jgi:hypothetical protein
MIALELAQEVPEPLIGASLGKTRPLAAPRSDFRGCPLRSGTPKTRPQRVHRFPVSPRAPLDPHLYPQEVHAKRLRPRNYYDDRTK